MSKTKIVFITNLPKHLAEGIKQELRNIPYESMLFVYGFLDELNELGVINSSISDIESGTNLIPEICHE